MDKNKKWTSIRQTFEQNPLFENIPRWDLTTSTALNNRRPKTKEFFKSNKNIVEFLYGNQSNKNPFNIEDDKSSQENSKIMVSPLQKRRKALPLAIDKRSNFGGPLTFDANEERIKNYDPDLAPSFNENKCNKQLPNSLVFYKSPIKQAQSSFVKIVSPGSCVWPDFDYKKEKRRLEDSISEFDSDENSPAEEPKNPSKCNQILTDDTSTTSINTRSIQPFPNQPELCGSNLYSEKEKRQRKPKKGGLAEKLTKSLDRAKSNYAFWQHERNIKLIPSSSAAKVTSVDCTYSSIMIHLTSNDQKIIVFLNSESKIAKKMYPGLDIEIDLTGPHYKLNDTVVYPYVDKILI